MENSVLPIFFYKKLTRKVEHVSEHTWSITAPHPPLKGKTRCWSGRRKGTRGQSLCPGAQRSTRSWARPASPSPSPSSSPSHRWPVLGVLPRPFPLLRGGSPEWSSTKTTVGRPKRHKLDSASRNFSRLALQVLVVMSWWLTSFKRFTWPQT